METRTLKTHRPLCGKTPLVAITCLALSSVLGGCASAVVGLPASGPGGDKVLAAAQDTRGIQVVKLDEATTRKLLANRKSRLFSDTLGSPGTSGYSVGAGDVVEVSLWEAPPATLFSGGTAPDTRMGLATTRVTTFPEQISDVEGGINIPFAGQIKVVGQTPRQIETEIIQKLKGKANQPQVLVRVTRNNTSNVLVVGEVTTSTRVPLTTRGERVLDALAAAGGVRQPILKTTLQVTRGGTVQAMPLDAVIRDPAQNVVLRPGDVITAMYQPLSFTALGATVKNEEVNFETQGISLAQALARAGGLNDARADARAVFVFRLEDAKDLPSTLRPAPDAEGQVPVIYNLDLKDPASFFVAQNFLIENKDVVYVANAPAADLQKFMNLVLPAAYPILNQISLF